MPRTLTIVTHHHQRELSFRTYGNFDDLAADGATVNALIECYQLVFGESEVWGEAYSRDDVLAKLRDELAGEASLRICQDRSGNVLGFCWAQRLGAAQVMRAVETIKFYQSIALPDLSDRIDALLTGARVLYVHDLGIARSVRGRIPLTQLIYPVLADLAGRTGTDRVLFWSMPDTLVSTLARRGRCAEYPMPNGMGFHLGAFRAHHANGVVGLRWIREEGNGRRQPQEGRQQDLARDIGMAGAHGLTASTLATGDEVMPMRRRLAGSEESQGRLAGGAPRARNRISS